MDSYYFGPYTIAGDIEGFKTGQWHDGTWVIVWKKERRVLLPFLLPLGVPPLSLCSLCCQMPWKSSLPPTHSFFNPLQMTVTSTLLRLLLWGHQWPSCCHILISCFLLLLLKTFDSAKHHCCLASETRCFFLSFLCLCSLLSGDFSSSFISPLFPVKCLSFFSDEEFPKGSANGRSHLLLKICRWPFHLSSTCPLLFVFPLVHPLWPQTLVEQL